MTRARSLESFAEMLIQFDESEAVAENQKAGKKMAVDIHEYIMGGSVQDKMNGLLAKLRDEKNSPWQDLKTFWPPRCIEAFEKDKGVIFFGAGLSIPCGIPSWSQLLRENFDLDETLITDEDLKNDPLTLAQLASAFRGNERLQDILRDVMKRPRPFSINHVALAALACPIYLTTNYDDLFEKAYEQVHGKEMLEVIANETDLARYSLDKEHTRLRNSSKAVLYKIHGSADRPDEQLILTRRDYRYHYRMNKKLFETIKKILSEEFVVFVGFSHKDPEVSRLVEDVIHEYEQQIDEWERQGGNSENSNITRPHFYSLQFDMQIHTPEVFAARGIVALSPPILDSWEEDKNDKRTKGLAFSLVDLLGAGGYGFRHKTRSVHMDLDSRLQKVTAEISEPISNAIYKLEQCKELAEKQLESKSEDEDWLRELCNELNEELELAGQGIYLLDKDGKILQFEVPGGSGGPNGGLNKKARTPLDKNFSFRDRPYFRQAKSFRQPYVSDIYASVYNEQATFFICVPLTSDNGPMNGLLFAATQIGKWKLPIKIADRFWNEELSFLLIDANGVCMIPPHGEFDPVNRSMKKKLGAQEIVDSIKEQKDYNYGYLYDKLLDLSRRDNLIIHINRNVVPLKEDDDLFRLPGDYKSDEYRRFTMVGTVHKSSRWKIGISVPIDITN